MITLAIIISLIFTWGVGLAIPLILRSFVFKRPVSKGIALAIVIANYILQLFLSLLMGNNGRHTALLLVAFVAFGILNKGYVEYMIKKSVYGKEEIPKDLDLEEYSICPDCQNKVHVNATICNKCNKQLAI